MATDAWTMHVPKKRRIKPPNEEINDLTKEIMEDAPSRFDLTQQASREIAKKMLFHRTIIQFKNESPVYQYVAAIAKRIRVPIDKLWSEPYSSHDTNNYETNEEARGVADHVAQTKAYADVHKWCRTISKLDITEFNAIYSKEVQRPLDENIMQSAASFFAWYYYNYKPTPTVEEFAESLTRPPTPPPNSTQTLPSSTPPPLMTPTAPITLSPSGSATVVSGAEAGETKENVYTEKARGDRVARETTVPNTITMDVSDDLVAPYYQERYKKYLYSQLRKHYEGKVIEEAAKWCNHNLVVDTHVDPEITQVTREVLRYVRKIPPFQNTHLVQFLNDDNYRTLLAECVSLKISHNQSVMLKRYATKFMMKELKRQIGRSMYEWRTIKPKSDGSTTLPAKWK